jgi:CRP-like cAMP-binding protein
MPQKFLDKLVQNRFQSAKQLRKLLQEGLHDAKRARHRPYKPRRHRNAPKYLKGVHNGVYYRIRLPQQRSLPDLQKIPSPTLPPKAFKPLPPKESHKAQSRKEGFEDFWKRARVWWKENYPVVILNFGSICTLTGFTRSDVLELRVLSVVGSLGSAVYNLTRKPILVAPLLWSATFAAVNGYKIFEIIRERKGTVRLSAEQETWYTRFFMPHGVTPKQFEAIHNRAQIFRLQQGSCLIKQHDKLEYVYLIVDGTTRASILGRHLTAASVTPVAYKEKEGGASGAWVGEMAFLEAYWNTEQGQKHQHSDDAPSSAQPPQRQGRAATQSDHPHAPLALAEAAAAAVSAKDAVAVQGSAATRSTSNVLKSSHSLYTIVAKEDCVVMRWSHADMEALMARSTDLRAAMTRAMTAAIVGKVINFTVSKSSALPTWSTWLDDWKHNAGARISVQQRPTPVKYLVPGEGEDEMIDKRGNVENHDRRTLPESVQTYPTYR